MGASAKARSELTADSPLQALRGVGPVRAAQLTAAGYETLGDLLLHLPFRYEDRRTLHRVEDVAAPGAYTLRGRLNRLSRVRIRRRGLSLVSGSLTDASGSLPVVWFNRPYLPSQIEEGGEYLLHGTARERGGAWELVNPSVEAPEDAALGAAVVPVYPAAGALGGPLLRRLVRQALAEVGAEGWPEEPLPEAVRARRALPPLAEALRTLHAPSDDADVERLNARRSAAHRRLIYGELLEQQLELAAIRAAGAEIVKAQRYALGEGLRRLLASIPPFELTAAQRRSLDEILEDLGRPHPMARLLQGDVGSGKTIVAALALVAALESGLQAALMAPTEILAEQHYATLGRLLGERYRIGLATGSVEDGAELRRGLAEGSVQLAIGTHALIEERVGFANLGLAVIDEQHRFGVAQRRRLQGKGDSIDLLVMTATPIPRSLALTAYGDLDLSVIDELPPGRRPVATQVVEDPDPEVVVHWLEARLAEGHRAYVVLPLIEASSKVKAAALETRGDELRRRLAQFAPAIVHGRTPADERARLLARFADGSCRLLIATTVIEVGLDVPEAGAMVIENAERFGLAQLHQLRGRVGRGGRESHCLAVCREPTDEARLRLEAFERSADGFELAEADLAIRGPGDLLGTRQAGLPMLRLANLVRDREWLEAARADAAELLTQAGEPATAALLAGVRERAAARAAELSS